MRRVVDNRVGHAVREKLLELVRPRGPAILDFGNRSWVNQALVDGWTNPQESSRLVMLVTDAWFWGIPNTLLELSGRLPGTLLFPEVMRPFAHNGSRIPYGEAAWTVGAWEYALKDHLPVDVLALGRAGQDRTAYLRLRRPVNSRMEKIERWVEQSFRVKLAPTKVQKRESGHRTLGDGWELNYSFGRAADGREYLEWRHYHRFSLGGLGVGRIFEVGQEA